VHCNNFFEKTHSHHILNIITDTGKCKQDVMVKYLYYKIIIIIIIIIIINELLMLKKTNRLSVCLAQLVEALAAPTHIRSCVQEIRVRFPEQTKANLASIPPPE